MPASWPGAATRCTPPFGAGILLGPRRAFVDEDPFLAGGSAVEPVDLDEVLWIAPPEREEAGLKVAAAATGVGLLTGFFGVGGGFVIVPALVLALGFEMPAAVGTSLLVISINSAPALAARLGAGVHLDWPLIGVFTLAALAGQRRHAVSWQRHLVIADRGRPHVKMICPPAAMS